ncbi:hypothetical protein DDT52_00970 [Brenneria roseae subsp. roseae]|nr:hypothetical protein DDT52_00970 [Brenneria roseae subsp. roseae]
MLNLILSAITRSAELRAFYHQFFKWHGQLMNSINNLDPTHKNDEKHHILATSGSKFQDTERGQPNKLSPILPD